MVICIIRVFLGLDGECGKFYDRAAFERRLMGAQADAGPISGLFCVGERIAPFFEREMNSWPDAHASPMPAP